MLTPASTVVILGFGTRASIFAALLAPRGCALRAWDPLLASPASAIHRARIEAAGVDAIADVAIAMRGARLVVVDEIDRNTLDALPLQAGQKILDLATAPAAEMETVLVALGVPAAKANWAEACANNNGMTDCDAMPNPPAVPRGELP